jgi:formate hydrogenlyase subunit 3/multisubunit Na+/H+ antiporter MnhD subunit
VLGAVAYALSRVSPLACRVLALGGSLAALIGGVMLIGEPASSANWAWVRLTDTLSLELDLAVTPLGLVAVIGSSAFALLIAFYSVRLMAGRYWEGKFYAYLLWALSGACVVGLAGNLLVLLVGWELVTLMLFLMVNQGRRGAREGAAKAYGLLGFTDACLLLAIVLWAVVGGSGFVIPDKPVAVGAEPMGATGYVIYALILIAALAKAGAIPVHTWIPSIAEKAPAPLMAFLPASVDKLLGIYLLAVLSLRMFRPDATMQGVMMVLGAVTILAAVLMAMIQHNLKRLLSFHAVSQVGYMVLGIGTGTAIGVTGGLLHMINHAIYKSDLFLMSGTVRRATGSDEIEDMGGLARHLPVTFASGLVAALAISGVPPFNGFVSKWLVYQGTLSLGSGLATAVLVVAVFGSALTLASFVKVIYSAFLAPAPKSPKPVTEARTRPRESIWLAAPMVVLAVACIVLGLWPQLIIDNVLVLAIPEGATTGAALVTTNAGLEAGGTGLWYAGPATVLILIGIALGMVLIWVATRKSRVRIVRPFLAGELPLPSDDRFRMPGTHFYETIAKLPIVGPLLAHGEVGAMDVYHWSGRHGNTLVQLLRRQHTGLISLYVAWVLLGLAVTLVYLLLSAGT